MREDGPTLPHVRSYASEASGDEEEAGRTPTWPLDRGPSQPSSSNYLMPLILGASLFLNAVLLIVLLSVLVFGRSGVFSLGNSPPGSLSPVSSGSTSGHGLSSPTVVIQSHSHSRVVASNSDQCAFGLQW